MGSARSTTRTSAVGLQEVESAMGVKVVIRKFEILTAHEEVGPCGRCENEEEERESDHDDEARRGSG
jgi:hypothetical protein